MYPLLLSLAAVIVATKLLGEFARRIGQPAVLGELLGGVILGGSALALLDPNDPAMHALSELGLFVLIFQVGLETDWRKLRRVGASALFVAVTGVVLPFGAGFIVARAFGIATLPAVIAGASLTATSIAISSRVLADKGLLHTREGQIVLGAALADDLIGLVLLSIVAAAVGGASVSAAGLARASLVSVGFIVVAIAAGSYAMPPLFRSLDRFREKGTVGLIAVAVGLVYAGLAVASGTALLVGAFVAGLILHPLAQRQEIERTTTQLGHLFVPVFFASVGASIELSSLAGGTALALGAALVLVGVAGKVIAGYAPRRFQGNKLLVGVAMIPRGEVGLVFAQVGLATTAISPQVFSAMMLMVVITTFIAPPLLAAVIRRDEYLEAADYPEPDLFTQGRRRETTVGRRHGSEER